MLLKHPTGHRTAPQQRIIQRRMSVVPRLRNPALEVLIFIYKKYRKKYLCVCSTNIYETLLCVKLCRGCEDLALNNIDIVCAVRELTF